MTLGPLPPANADLAVAGKPSFAYAQYLKSLDAAVRSPAVATTSVAGVVKPDGTTITVAADGTISTVDTDTNSIALLNTLTANNSATLSDTTSLTAAYSEYEIHLQNLIPATNEKILQLQVHSGGAFKNTGYITQFAGDAGGGAIGLSSLTTGVPLSYPADANADAPANTAPGLSGCLKVVTPSTAGLIMIYGTVSYLGGGGNLVFGTVQGYWNTSGVVDGFQLLMDSGNLTSGTVKIYGVS